ncbi:hypothetical protein K435DRAFT_801650 [Dendrothele bispora CBS 962.96]|uniref:Uncharacterized protein n=1 Tax=Dendrothele bispora (strain CBS 962.96) TaxID=1314807 RepID=A0A4S8LPN8_DENBC|nr:hypothetical protein K435DRAFT_801650 [Dendrothele bispora CBS 962.96]
MSLDRTDLNANNPNTASLAPGKSPQALVPGDSDKHSDTQSAISSNEEKEPQGTSVSVPPGPSASAQAGPPDSTQENEAMQYKYCNTSGQSPDPVFQYMWDLVMVGFWGQYRYIGWALGVMESLAIGIASAVSQPSISGYFRSIVTLVTQYLHIKNLIIVFRHFDVLSHDFSELGFCKSFQKAIQIPLWGGSRRMNAPSVV